MTLNVESKEPHREDHQLLAGKTILPGLKGEWSLSNLGNLLRYEQPGKYIVKSTAYESQGHIPVLTAGKTFILGYTRETEGVFSSGPVVIFDDFTTASQFVDFQFKVKSSAMKILHSVPGVSDIRFMYELLQTIKHLPGDHKRYWISEYQKMEVVVPNLEEQIAIANVLSDVNLLMESLDKLIAKKRAIKQGVMQQLLTGQKRLPGFSDEWKHIQINDLGSFHKGRGIRKNEVQTYGIACVRYGEVYTRFETSVHECFSFISKKVAETSEPLVFGDIIFAVSGETSLDIGKCVSFLGNFEAYIGSDTVVLRPVGHDSAYLGYALNHGNVSIQKTALGQGDAVVHLSASNLKNIQFRLPPSLAEQQAIAQVLSDMDAEIGALVKQKEKIALIKTGMMQDLLTGKVRL